MPRLWPGNGFFINTALLMYSMLVNAWLCLLLVLLSGVSGVNTSVLDESLAVVGGLQLLQLGSLSVLVYIATVWLEDGFFTTIKNVLKQFVAGTKQLASDLKPALASSPQIHVSGITLHGQSSIANRHLITWGHVSGGGGTFCSCKIAHAAHFPQIHASSEATTQLVESQPTTFSQPAGSIFFYVFRGQTSATAFMSDLTYGGATYAATGRGYKLKVSTTQGCRYCQHTAVHLAQHALWGATSVHRAAWDTASDRSEVASTCSARQGFEFRRLLMLLPLAGHTFH